MDRKIVRLCDKAESARHVSPAHALRAAVASLAHNEFTKGFRKCVIIFDDHKDGCNKMHYFVAGATGLERIGIAERFKADAIKQQFE